MSAYSVSFSLERARQGSIPTMISALLLVLLCLLVAGESAKPLVSRETLNRGHSGKGPLPLASASPWNVEDDMDCVVKTLAWEFAKKILPRVSLQVTF